MKWFLGFALLAWLVFNVSAWEKEDHEIFDLVEAVEKSEGKGTTFYSWLEVPSSASTAEISKAYRKKSMRLHPDKNPNLKNAHERFSRLGVVAAILRAKEGRERYDFFYKNGVPKWRGTGYYYERFRPGIAFVGIFLTVLTSLVQYIVQRFQYTRDTERVQMIIKKAKLTAWGQNMVPMSGKRKVKVNLSESEEGPGRMLDMIVETDGSVYLVDPDGTQHLLDPNNTATPAAVTRTWALSLIMSLVAKVKPQTKPSASNDTDDSEPANEEDTPISDEKATNGNSGVGARVPAQKAGGKRRKAVRKL